jgi:energy-coupling factor transporter ATP-binding protein EcfA2
MSKTAGATIPAVASTATVQTLEKAKAQDTARWENASGAQDVNKRARLLSLQMHNFKCFEERRFSFEGDECICIVGPNSCGKSSILDAIKFINLHPESRTPRALVRRCRPPVSRCSVVAVFESERFGKISLKREVILDGPERHRLIFAVQYEDKLMEDVSEPEYASWIEKLACWREGDVFMKQFSLLENNSVMQLLKRLQQALEQLEAETVSTGPMLKRRAVGQSIPTSSLTSKRRTAEAWVGRRLDELYRELSREPLDEQFEAWGDGGQACLRRLQDGSFTIFVSQRRGLAALGYGSPLESLSDGDKDLCALALLLILPGLSAATGLQDALPPLVVLDEPDSRLDKKRAMCLRRLLCGPERPGQCLLMSLNNHKAFSAISSVMEMPELVIEKDAFGINGDPGEDNPYGDVRPRRRPH